MLSRVNLHLIRGIMKGALFTICKVVSKCALQFDKLELMQLTSELAVYSFLIQQRKMILFVLTGCSIARYTPFELIHFRSHHDQHHYGKTGISGCAFFRQSEYAVTLSLFIQDGHIPDPFRDMGPSVTLENNSGVFRDPVGFFCPIRVDKDSVSGIQAAILNSPDHVLNPGNRLIIHGHGNGF